jgi:beta-galactosidase
VAFDETMQPVEAPDVELLVATDAARVDRAVARAVEALDLLSVACDPGGIHATVHEDDQGAPRVVFAINASERDVLARITLGVDASWEDAIEGGTAHSELGVLEVRVLPWTVRMLARC